MTPQVFKDNEEEQKLSRLSQLTPVKNKVQREADDSLKNAQQVASRLNSLIGGYIPKDSELKNALELASSGQIEKVQFARA